MSQPTVKVKMIYGDVWYFGFITIQREIDAKVMFECSSPVVDISAFPDYWYYKNIELFQVTEDEYRAIEETYKISKQ